MYVYWTQQSSRRDKKRVVRVFFARTQHDNTSHHITSTTNRKKSNLTYATTDIARAHRHHCLWAAINVKTLFAHKCKIECYYSTRLSYTYTQNKVQARLQNGLYRTSVYVMYGEEEEEENNFQACKNLQMKCKLMTRTLLHNLFQHSLYQYICVQHRCRTHT